jgi:hypothetical protein
MLFVRFWYCTLALSFFILLHVFFHQSFSNCKTKACILWTDSASFTWFGTLKLCYQWNACFCSTSCFEKCLPRLLEMYTPGCCSGISFMLNTCLMFLREYIRVCLENCLKTVVASQMLKTILKYQLSKWIFRFGPYH